MKKITNILLTSTLAFGMGLFAMGLPARAETPVQREEKIDQEEKNDQQDPAASTEEVKAIQIENIPFGPIIPGTRLKLSATISPAIGKKKILWSSSKPKVARITSKGVVRACKKGTTVITAKIKNTNQKASFKLRVKNPIKLKKIAINGKPMALVGNSVQLTATLYPKNTTDWDITWKSSNKKVAKVDKNGLVTTKKAGKVTITAKERNRKKSKKFKLSILKVPVTSIQFASNNKTSMETGTKLPLSVRVMPQNATNRKLKWKSDNPSAATVDQNGTVTALRPIENVTITATSADNKKLCCSWNIKITITNGYITKSMLDKLDLTAIHKVMIVAHPDDETLWGGAHLLENEYLIVCMTNGWNEKRKAAFYNVMRKTNDKGIILNYPDIKKSLGKGKYEADLLTTSLPAIKKDVERILSYKKWEEVVTHNPFGEYGKYHHQQISKAVTDGFQKICKKDSQLWYFGKYYAKGRVPGEQIHPELLYIKNKMISIYYPTARGAIDAFGHMIPYENWIPEEKW